MLLARTRHLEGDLQNAFYLRACVNVRIVGFVVVLVLLAEIHTAGEFTDDDKVGTAQQFFLQR